MAESKKNQNAAPAQDATVQQDPAQVNAQLEQQAAEKKLDEAPASGAVYIVDGRKVNANGEPVKDK